MTEFRIERDSLGEVKVPKDALYGAQTQRAIQNFPISNLTIPRTFIRALGLIKAAAAQANAELGLLDQKIANAIKNSALLVSNGDFDSQFPIDVFQTGSGTSSNMNANEVIASLASQSLNQAIHPNDQVNMSQSSNDVIPSAIHIAAMLDTSAGLLPALTALMDQLEERETELKNVTKTGRTHLMDAVPITFGQEISGWRSQINIVFNQINFLLASLQELAIGGTAIGTGINADPNFAQKTCEFLNQQTKLKFTPGTNYFALISGQETMCLLSGQLKSLACALIKIANDLRFMNSGPLSGLNEIKLQAIQPGSSIMPGKINPVIPEVICMIGAQVIGNDTTIAVAGQSGHFQLNVMLPVIGYNIIQSLQILTNACKALAFNCINSFTVNKNKIQESLQKNPILVTALNPLVGYELGAKIAKTAYSENRPVIEVALELTDLTREQLEDILDPAKLTRGGLSAATDIASAMTRKT